MLSLTCLTRPFVCLLGGVAVASADTRDEAWDYVLLHGFRSHTVIGDDVRPVTFGGWEVVSRSTQLQAREAGR